MKTRLFCLAALTVLIGVALGQAGERPFPGKYDITGDLAQLLTGEKIHVEEFVTPLCSQCYLYHREQKTSYGDDVAVTYTYVFHGQDGRAPVRLLLLAHLAKPETEAKLLHDLFAANFEKKAPIQDEQILKALAQVNGLGEAFEDPVWQKKVDAEMTRLEKMFEKMGAPPKTPRLVINNCLTVSPGIAGVQGDDLPPLVTDLLDQVRQYRERGGK